MNLENLITNLIQECLKSGEKDNANILRQALGEIKNFKINNRGQEVSDNDGFDMIKRVIKQTTETRDKYLENAGIMTGQIEYLQSLLPQQLDGAALEAKVAEIVSSLGLTSKKDTGTLMKELKSATDGNFDKKQAVDFFNSLVG